MFGKLIAASAVISLLSATAAFAEPAATSTSATSVAKIQDLSRARRHLDTGKRSHAAEAGTLVLVGLGGAAAGFGIDEATKSNP
ncbi:hypothetical protein [Novosphingobium sp.]|uniref:hypothetical protein n=1 Tax=Novosphingobium sp. TaxID=1874826 RepID=UPI00333FEFD5